MNNEKKPHQPQNPQRTFFVYAGIALLGLLLVQYLVLPWFQNSRVVEVPYNEFLAKVEANEVTRVELDEATGRIDFEVGKSETDDTSEATSETTATVAGIGPAAATTTSYYTGLIDDSDLVQRLEAATGPDGEPIEFTQTVPVQQGILGQLLSMFLPLLLILGSSYLLFRMLSKRMGGDAMSFGKSNAKVYVQAQTGITFDDVAGQDEAKEALDEIVDFLHNPDKYKSVGAKMPKGALLVGPPGTGKTLLAKAVAGEAGVPFFSIAGSEFVEMFVGRGAARVRDLFKQAKEKSPCIVFIDELDTIGKKRDGAGLNGNDEREQTLNQLLSEMDGFDGSSGVVILAATNRPESLDAALLRPGRFDRRIPVELPDLKGREAILQVHAKQVMMDDDINWNVIARTTSGASGADLANIVNESALRAVKHNRRMVVQADLMESVETVIAGQQRKNKVINQKEKKIIAYHEVGHALVAAMQTHSAPVTKITIIPRTSGALGYTMQVEEEEQNLMSRKEAFNRMATLAGGRSAEELIFDVATTGAANDIEKLTKMARSMVTRYGMSEEFDMMALETVTNQYLGGDTQLACGPETAAAIDREVLALIRSAHEKARRILEENKEKLHELSAYLLEKETITGEEFMQVLGMEDESKKEDESVASVEESAKEDERVTSAEESTKEDERVTSAEESTSTETDIEDTALTPS